MYGEALHLQCRLGPLIIPLRAKKKKKKNKTTRKKEEAAAAIAEEWFMGAATAKLLTRLR